MKALKKPLAGYLVAVAAIVAVTAVCFPLHQHFTDTTVALAMVVVVLFVATAWGKWPALAASIAGMLCFNYFFLPPTLTLTIDDPENWIALAAFFITALTTGRLSARAKQRAAALATERKRLLDVLDLLPAYVILLTPDYHVAFANRFFRERFGESQGRRCFEYLFGRDQPCEVCETYKVLKTGAPLCWEWTGPDNRQYDISDFPFTDSDGSACILEMGIDVTEHRRAERESRSLAQLQAAVAELGQEALHGGPAGPVLDHAVTLVARNLEVEYCKVLELLPGGEALLLRSGVGWKEGLAGHATVGSGTDSQAGYTLLSGEPVIVEDLRTEKRFSGPPLLHEHGVVSGLSVVIATRSGPYGVFGAHTRQRRAFTKDEVHFLQAVAHVLGNMIERQRSEEALREREASLNRAQEIAHIGSWRLDIPLNRLMWSDEVFRIFDLPKGTPLTYQVFVDMVYPEDRERVERAWNFALQGGAPYDIEHRILVNGQLKWVRERAEVEFDRLGKPAGGIGTVQDITARKLAQEAFQKSADEICDLYNNAPCGYHSLDENGAIVRMNDTELSWLGYTRDELIGKKFSDLLTPQSREVFQQSYSRFKTEGAIRDLEFDLVRKDGSFLPALVSATAVRDAGGAYRMSRSTVYDITARKRAEAEIRRINRAHRALSRCNEALIRATDEATLLQRICQVAVEEAGYRLCWVGRAEQDEHRSVKPIAQAGFEDGYLSTLRLTWKDTERGQGPTGTCLRTGQTVVAKNFATDRNLALWRNEALKRGYASSLAIPLLIDSSIFGALMIYASEPDAFGAEEVQLLTELANDLAFGIMVLRTKAQHARAEAEIRTLNAGLEQRVTERTAELQAANAALERAREREFEIGFRIQQILLLDLPPADIPGLQIAALSLPSQRIDGDFYAFFKYQNQSLDVIVGDVMGKGIPAALLGAATKSQLLMALSQRLAVCPVGTLPEPSEIVMQAHAEIVRQLMDLDSFVTLCYAQLDMRSRQLRLVDCGHTGTLHWHARTGLCEVLHGDNLPLGVRSDEVYTEITIPFEAGDLFFFYSDGITEARNAAGELFGVERLQQCVRDGGEQEPEVLIETVRRAVALFSGSSRLADDLTSVAVRATAHAEIEIRSDPGELRRMREFVHEFCGEAPGSPLEPDSVSALELAVHEAAVNIMKHAYHGRADESIHLDGDAFPGHVSIRLHHLGDSFDPAAVPPPAFDGSRESGFGTYMISRSVDEVRYYRDERGGCCVELVKTHKS